MPTKILIGLVVVVGLIAGVSGYFYGKQDAVTNRAEAKVEKTVTEFGKALKNVSLLSPTMAGDIQEHYGEFLTPELLAAWKAKPSSAVGRKTSSPYPDRIEIASTTLIEIGKYGVTGDVVEVTNTGEAGRTPIRLVLEDRRGGWLIASVSWGNPTIPNSTTTTITQSGINGIVLQGPMCGGPVWEGNPNPECKDQPYSGALELTNPDQSELIARFSSDKFGKFTVKVPPGVYSIQSPSGDGYPPYPRCSVEDTITVSAGAFKDVIVHCDTGIR